MRRLWLILALLVALPIAAVGDPDNPDGVARAYFAAMAKEGLAAGARFYDPEALAEYKRFQLGLLGAGGFAGTIAQGMFPGAPPLDELEALDARRFYETLIQHDISFAVSQRITKKTLGVVMEGDSLAHFVVRTRRSIDGAPAVESVDVLSLRKQGDRWFVQMPTELGGMQAGAAGLFDGASNHAPEQESD